MILPIKANDLSFRANNALSVRDAYDKKTRDNDNIAKDAAKQPEIPTRSPQVPIEGCGKKLDIVA